MRKSHLWFTVALILLLTQALPVPQAFADGPEQCLSGEARCFTRDLSAIELRAINAEITVVPGPQDHAHPDQ